MTVTAFLNLLYSTYLLDLLFCLFSSTCNSRFQTSSISLRASIIRDSVVCLLACVSPVLSFDFKRLPPRTVK